MLKLKDLMVHIKVFFFQYIMNLNNLNWKIHQPLDKFNINILLYCISIIGKVTECQRF